MANMAGIPGKNIFSGRRGGFPGTGPFHLIKQNKEFFVSQELLNKEEQEKIARAVRRAEEKTSSGEIATALIRESSDYAVYELVFSPFHRISVFFLLCFSSIPLCLMR